MAKKIKITKVRELEDAVNRYHIEEGFEKVGFFVAEPRVGEPFYVGMEMRTSPVQELLPDNYFRTLNSIYKYEFLDEAA